MTLSIKLDKPEFCIMQKYIEQSCGIHIAEEKTYLIETRLATLIKEYKCTNYTMFHCKAVADRSNILHDKIIDAMTTNETLWFRDTIPFEIMDKILLPEFAKDIENGNRQKIRIWCAASSTGQEPYSIAMTYLEYMRTCKIFKPYHLDIMATDISPTVLHSANIARYNSVVISRGLSVEMKERYFEKQGEYYELKNNVKNLVTFKKLNLQDNFQCFVKYDIVFCRNVLIYFSDVLKQNILARIKDVLNPDGVLFLGASESIPNCAIEYKRHNCVRGFYYTK